MEAHSPYHPPRDYLVPYLGDDVDKAKELSIDAGTWTYISGKEQKTTEDFRILNALYDGELLYLDFRIGQLLDYLREINIMDDTILIITADHGENFGDHQLMGHCLCVYDTLVHVPLIIRYPKSFDPGLRVDEQVQTTDLYPTILDIIGIDWNGGEQIQGCNLLKDIEHRPSAFAIAEHAFCLDAFKVLMGKNGDLDILKFVRRLKTIRIGEYKYIWASDGRDELYNIRLDSEELDNLIDDEPEKAEELKALLIEWLESFETFRPGAAQQVK